MIERELPTPEDDSDRKLLADIAEYGWHIIIIEPDDDGPGFAFSIGLFHTFEHPEILLFGLGQESAMGIINGIGAGVQHGQRFETGKQSSDVVEGFPVDFVEVPPDCYKQYVGYAVWFYESLRFPVLQCVWPDKAGIFPWEPKFNTNLLALQPVVGAHR